jgi:hypothetical protein
VYIEWCQTAGIQIGTSFFSRKIKCSEALSVGNCSVATWSLIGEKIIQLGLGKMLKLC